MDTLGGWNKLSKLQSLLPKIRKVRYCTPGTSRVDVKKLVDIDLHLDLLIIRLEVLSFCLKPAQEGATVCV